MATGKDGLDLTVTCTTPHCLSYSRESLGQMIHRGVALMAFDCHKVQNIVPKCVGLRLQHPCKKKTPLMYSFKKINLLLFRNSFDTITMFAIP